MTKLIVTVPAVSLEFDKKVLKQTLRTAGNEVASATKRLIRSSAGGGKVYYGSGGSSGYRRGYRSGKYRASAPGQAPVSVTGNLIRSIRVRPFKSGEGVAVREGAFYALFLAAGAHGGVGSGKVGVKGRRNKRSGLAGSRVLAPRPSLSTALDAKRSDLEKRIGEAAEKGISLRHLGGRNAAKGAESAVKRALAGRVK